LVELNGIEPSTSLEALIEKRGGTIASSAVVFRVERT
jgi:hypothetical protein